VSGVRKPGFGHSPPGSSEDRPSFQVTPAWLQGLRRFRALDSPQKVKNNLYKGEGTVPVCPLSDQAAEPSLPSLTPARESCVDIMSR
jgi:hypothetical protein